MGMALLFYRDSSGLSNVKILITLPYGEGGVWTEEFMAEDLSEEDIVGHFDLHEPALIFPSG